MKKNIPPQQLRVLHEDSMHVPVLLQDTIELLNPQKGERYLDLTAGYGGHASRIASTVGDASLTLVDRDSNAIRALDGFKQAGARLLHMDFVTAAQTLIEAGERFDMILVDFGVSSPQLDNASRGFSIKRDGPLDMRMDDRMDRTAADIVNTSSKEKLVRILTTYGEERLSRARSIALAIVKARPIHTTHELADVILTTHRGGYQKVHPATRTFQAIRIALNQELQQIEQLLPLLPKLLMPKGRVALISFHSLEDRLVKRYLKEQSSSGYESEFELLTKQPIRGDKNDVHNPRARSATLRAAVKK